MAKFNFTESFSVEEIISTKLSALAADTAGLASGYLTDADVGKAVKLGATDRYVLAVAGDEIEAFIVAVESATVDGYSFGSVVLAGRKSVVLEGSVAIGGLVVVATPVAKGVASATALLVKAGTAASQSGTSPFAYTARTPNTHLWRLISGAGTAGSVGVIERVGEA
ncbi:hypothetical protein [Methylotenera sp.]|uniref:hypothetical protein n=1 Tax=Methylotenera sp. TaxID=2051956 RepID=UPI002488332D|nr:hypothetical protein [Methylotenera sp.]MDI1362519.1 hypothetical protein [Methylotenera sp.]